MPDDFDAIARADMQRDVDAAQAELDSYAAILERLRPIMENDPTITVREAIERLRQADNAR
jgi:hypothetical protein